MSAVQPVPFIGGASLSRSRNFDPQQLINYYVEASGSGQARDVAMLVGCPGLDLMLNLDSGGGGIRGMIRFSKTLAFIVAGSNVYAVTNGWVSYLIGSIILRQTPVSMASNGQQIVMACGAEGYIITPNPGNPAASAISQVVNLNFHGADNVDFLDDYFIFNWPGTGKFQITGLLSTSLSGLDFASAEGSPDLLLGLRVNQREVWLFGENSTEIFYNSGNASFPIERIQGAFIEKGIVGPYAHSKATNPDGTAHLFWLSADDNGQGIAVQSQGYSAVRISKHEQEFAWAQYPTLSDAIGCTYQQEGHTFPAWHFPSGNASWYYDLTTQLWHQRAWRNPGNNSLNRHRTATAMAFAGRIVVGDWENGKVYAFNLDRYDDAGDVLPAIRTAPHFASATNVNYIFDRFWIDMETGVGLSSGQGSDPQMILEWSDDGGHTFPNSRSIPIGKVGEYGRRAIATKTGRSRDRVWRSTITDPVKRILIGAGASVRECRQ